MKKSFAGAIIAVLVILNLYRLISTSSRIFINDQIWTEISETKSPALKTVIRDADRAIQFPWLGDHAPVMLWNSNETLKATDPREILPTAELWYRKINRFFPFLNDDLKNLGPFDPSNFKKISYDGATPTDDVTRLMETGGIDAGYAGFEIRYDSFMTPNLPAPLFWRISRHPLFKLAQPDDPHHAYLPIELWYHFNFNDTRWHFGNHDGDWESTLFVFDVKEENGKISAIPFVISISAHGGSSWHCEKDLSHSEQGRIELFNAWGTHATYAEPGNHWRLIYPDRTDRGEPWQTWNLIRPIEKESFYGFSGSWGRTSYIYFQNAPIPPGPHFKYLPADANIERAKSDFEKIVSECSKKN